MGVPPVVGVAMPGVSLPGYEIAVADLVGVGGVPVMVGVWVAGKPDGVMDFTPPKMVGVREGVLVEVTKTKVRVGVLVRVGVRVSGTIKVLVRVGVMVRVGVRDMESVEVMVEVRVMVGVRVAVEAVTGPKKVTVCMSLPMTSNR